MSIQVDWRTWMATNVAAIALTAATATPSSRPRPRPNASERERIDGPKFAADSPLVRADERRREDASCALANFCFTCLCVRSFVRSIEIESNRTESKASNPIEQNHTQIHI